MRNLQHSPTLRCPTTQPFEQAQNVTDCPPFTVVFQATFVNATMWTGYGTLVAFDPYIYVPNMLGLAASIIQLSMFAKYGIHKAK
jgi:hypothetical protein